MTDRRPSWPTLALLMALVVSLAAKLAVLDVGAPFISIDDRTTFEGGFLVWFGHAPPQGRLVALLAVAILRPLGSGEGKRKARVVRYGGGNVVGQGVQADAA